MYTIIASNSNTSINRQVATKINEKLNLNIIDVKEEEVPIYSPQLEIAGIPKEVQRIYDLIKSESKFIIFTPEYNGYTTPYFKNILDWLSRIEHGFLQGIDVRVISVSPGHSGGASVRKILSDSLPFFKANSVSTYGLGDFYTKVEDQSISDDLDDIVKFIEE